MSHKIQITLDDELYSDIKAGAKRTGLSISSYARTLLKSKNKNSLLDQSIADLTANRVESLTLQEFNQQFGDEE